ncbi:MerR family transcriptional regulator [Rudaeicoccus suwonensis]|nr:MerR family transcriptional regulator [Rudaeicoccus suwonensis]
MLTIGQLAAYAGVTVRAVRHYHAKGLLPEPERDSSGYRRYDAAAAVALIRIRTLAEAGVPLSRVRELLNADEHDFKVAINAVDARLRAEISERQMHRRRIAELAAGDSLALPPEAVSYLSTLRSIGVPELMVDAERDAWILVAAQLPDHMAFYMQMKQQQIGDPHVQQLYLDLAQIIDWPADDPGVSALVDRLIAAFEAFPDQDWDGDPMPDDLAALLDAVFLDSVPVAARVLAMLEQRGWTGWTKIKRTGPMRAASVADHDQPSISAHRRHT